MAISEYSENADIEKKDGVRPGNVSAWPGAWWHELKMGRKKERGEVVWRNSESKQIRCRRRRWEGIS